MDLTDSLYYLRPGFDLNKLKTPKLRGILVEHTIEYASDAKRGVLLETIKKQLLPNAAAILAANSKVTPSTEGIISIPAAKYPRSQGKRKALSDEGGKTEISPANCRNTHKDENGDDSPTAKRQRTSPSKPSDDGLELGAQVSEENERIHSQDPTTKSNEAGSTKTYNQRVTIFKGMQDLSRNLSVLRNELGSTTTSRTEEVLCNVERNIAELGSAVKNMDGFLDLMQRGVEVGKLLMSHPNHSS